MKKKKVLIFIITAAVMAVLCSITVFADGEVANAVSNTWTKARGQIKSIVNDVVFPVIDVVLAILLFVKISTSYMANSNGLLRRFWSAASSSPCQLLCISGL